MAITFRRVRRALRLALTVYRLEHEHHATIDYIVIDDCAYDPNKGTYVYVNDDRAENDL